MAMLRFSRFSKGNSKEDICRNICFPRDDLYRINAGVFRQGVRGASRRGEGNGENRFENDILKKPHA
ncbi:hypothetical protein [Nereida sp. MMG025]|uniref:hypothetical protein n=1 Tax=Nereida sp. MMG025 TaxID=2909981 RepID=UPI001F3006B9|nr:hypothetical protein [Nereida sp. MMG025]